MAGAAVPSRDEGLVLQLRVVDQDLRDAQKVRDRIDERLAELQANRDRLLVKRQRKTVLLQQLRDRRASIRDELRSALEAP